LVKAAVFRDRQVRWRHGISRALVAYEPGLRAALKPGTELII